MSVRASYVRTCGGRTVHQADCHVLRRVRTPIHPWKWAEGRTPHGLWAGWLTGVIPTDVHLCDMCLGYADDYGDGSR